ncbi:tetratricopeptide repeat protein [Clostridium butyricum]
MKYIENYLKEDKFYLDFKKYISFDEVNKKQEILNMVDKILEKIKSSIDSIYNIENNIDLKKSVEDIFQGIPTIIDLSVKIYVYLNGGSNTNSSKYKKIEKILEEKSEYKETKSLNWCKNVKEIRALIQHDAEALKIEKSKNAVYIQYFKEHGYPLILEFMEENKYIDAGIFFSYKLQCLLEYLKILFNYLIEENSIQSRACLREIGLEDKFFIEDKKLNLVEDKCKKAKEIINNYKENDIQNKELYERIEVISGNENNDQLIDKKKKLNDLKKEIEDENKFSRADDFLKSEVYFYLGNAQLLEKEWEQSRESYKRNLVYNQSFSIYTNIIKSYLDETYEDEKNIDKYLIELNCLIEEVNKNMKILMENDDKQQLELEQVNFYNNVACVYEKFNRYSEAIKYLNYSIDINFQLANNSLYNIAKIYQKLGNEKNINQEYYFDLAINNLEKLIQLNKKDELAYNKLLYLLVERKKFNEFKIYFLDGLSQNLLSPKFHEWCECIINSREQYTVLCGNDIINSMYDCLQRINNNKRTKQLESILNKLEELL